LSVWTAAASHLLPLLTDSATIISRTYTDDGALGGVWVETESAPVKCLLDRTGAISMEAVQSGALMSVERFQVALPLGTTVQPKDRLKIRGVLYEIVGSNQDQTTAAILALELQRVQ